MATIKKIKISYKHKIYDTVLNFIKSRRFPIRNTIFIIVVLLIGLPIILLTVLSMQISSSAIIDTIKNDSLVNMSTIEYGFELVINSIEGSLVEQSRNWAELNYYVYDNYLRTEERLSIFEKKIKEDCSYINKVTIISADDKGLISNDEHMIQSGIFFSTAFINNLLALDYNSDHLVREIMKNRQITYYDKNKNIFVTKPHYVSGSDGTLSFNISMLRPIMSPSQDKIVGFLMYSVDPKIFTELFRSVSEIKKCDFFILDKDFGVVSSLNSKYISSSFYSITGSSQIYFDKKKSEIYVNDNKDTIFTTKHTDILDLTFILLTPYEYLETLLNYNRYKLILLSIAGVLFSIIASALLSSKITNPVNNLQKHIDNFSQGNLHVQNTVWGNNEFADLSDSFNNMTKRISQLIDSLAQDESVIQNYKFRLTQAQINPHFLYNVLEMTSSLINLNMYEEAGIATTKLSQFYRTSLSDGADIVPLETEYQNVKNYLDLQKMRYIEFFDFQIDVQPETMQCSIPKMTIQPLIENAIYHGVRHTKRKGFVEVSIFIKDTRLHIIVRDNGAGISKEKIDELMADSTANIINRNFGVSSVVHRLNYYFNNDAKLLIDSCINSYTSVSISIPNIKYLQEEANNPNE